jgi:hypothetical protein
VLPSARAFGGAALVHRLGKNLAWCVYKKDHKWVREQAAKADAAKALKKSEVSNYAR